VQATHSTASAKYTAQLIFRHPGIYPIMRL
jgi:hypothetical protein